MARILYGVMGNTHGHIMRTSAIIENLSQHDFYMAGGGRVPAAFGDSYPVHELPVLRTVHKKQKVDVPAVVGQIVGRITQIPEVCRGLHDLIERWQPDLVVADREFFLPIACRMHGVRCVSIDHSHVMKACRYPVPHDQLVSWSLAMANDYALFDFTAENMVVSFFHPPLRAGRTDELLPPVLRREVRGLGGVDGETVFVYQTSPTFLPLLDVLRGRARRVIIYGMSPEARVEGNLEFRPYDRLRIVEDLAACAYVVVNGGHNLICEALHFGKPVLCFPIQTLFEQWINAWHVRDLGYGDFCTSLKPDLSVFERFEARLPEYAANLRGKHFDGTDLAAAALERRLVHHG